jgi:hypothetical protein
VGGHGTIIGIVLAVALMGFVTSALGLKNVPGIVMSIVVGSLLIVVAAIPALNRRIGALAHGRLPHRDHRRGKTNAKLSFVNAQSGETTRTMQRRCTTSNGRIHALDIDGVESLLLSGLAGAPGKRSAYAPSCPWRTAQPLCCFRRKAK